LLRAVAEAVASAQRALGVMVLEATPRPLRPDSVRAKKQVGKEQSNRPDGLITAISKDGTVTASRPDYSAVNDAVSLGAVAPPAANDIAA